jgi:uncharacterized protein YndB with AHSA1/START domain
MSGDEAVGALVVRKRIAATREEVFDAWTDPAGMRIWMCPGPIVSADVAMDLRVGGTFRILMRHGNATYEHQGTFTAIDRPNLLAFTWIANATDTRETLVTVEFVACSEEETELVLTHERWPRPEGRDQYRGGWTDITAKLALFIQTRRSSFRP